jgi:hypothetical protein
MKIVSPSGRPGKEQTVCITTRPKALIATAFSILGALACIAAYSYDYLHALRGVALAAEGLLMLACALFWRFDRPREVRFKGRFPEPPVIHGV